MRTYGQCGVAGHYPADAPSLPLRQAAPREPEHVTTRDYRTRATRSRRLVAARQARDALRSAGKTWTDARAWALAQVEAGSRRWCLADLPQGTVNVDAAHAYLAAIGQETEEAS